MNLRYPGEDYLEIARKTEPHGRRNWIAECADLFLLPPSYNGRVPQKALKDFKDAKQGVERLAEDGNFRGVEEGLPEIVRIAEGIGFANRRILAQALMMKALNRYAQMNGDDGTEADEAAQRYNLRPIAVNGTGVKYVMMPTPPPKGGNYQHGPAETSA